MYAFYVLTLLKGMFNLTIYEGKNSLLQRHFTVRCLDLYRRQSSRSCFAACLCCMYWLLFNASVNWKHSEIIHLIYRSLILLTQAGSELTL